MPYGEHCVMQEGPVVTPVPPVSGMVVMAMVVAKLFSASTTKPRIEVELDP